VLLDKEFLVVAAIAFCMHPLWVEASLPARSTQKKLPAAQNESG
jgi:hypothetical protein